MIDLTQFQAAKLHPWDTVRESRAIKVGQDSLAGWRCAPRKDVPDGMDVLCSEDKSVVVVLSINPGEGDDYLLTAYRGAVPKEVKEVVCGHREFADLTGDHWSYEGTHELCLRQLWEYFDAGGPPLV